MAEESYIALHLYLYAGYAAMNLCAEAPGKHARLCCACISGKTEDDLPQLRVMGKLGRRGMVFA